ncbi:hypothetical protein [Phreatobacter sp.]|uniref:hypothetical protein n=1 Tax=Phreatobacter sp. TaxID=1966341 RepID=UPI0025E1D085|nr:hypothetical protein [Phreatobacter sp.]
MICLLAGGKNLLEAGTVMLIMPGSTVAADVAQARSHRRSGRISRPVVQVA